MWDGFCILLFCLGRGGGCDEAIIKVLGESVQTHFVCSGLVILKSVLCNDYILLPMLLDEKNNW